MIAIKEQFPNSKGVMTIKANFERLGFPKHYEAFTANDSCTKRTLQENVFTF